MHFCVRNSPLQIGRCINKTFPHPVYGKVHTFLKTQRLSGCLLLCLVLFWASSVSSFSERLFSPPWLDSSHFPSLQRCCDLFFVSHRWVLSCVSNLWLSDSPALHFLLLPWLGTKERGSGLIRYLQVGHRRGGDSQDCVIIVVFTLCSF